MATTSKDSAVDTGAKNTRAKALRPMLRVLRQNIKTNFSASYAAEWYHFGFLKESYYSPAPKQKNKMALPSR